MALPVAHFSVALGLARSPRPGARRLVCLLSILPDFDFALVLAGLPLHGYHRTFSHSLTFCLLAALLWGLFWPRRWRIIPGWMVFAVLASHAAVDLACVADAPDHGVMLLWPFSQARLGWPLLVPVYRLLAETPFTVAGAAAFTLLELIMAWPLWLAAAASAGLFSSVRRSLFDSAEKPPGHWEAHLTQRGQGREEE